MIAKRPLATAGRYWELCQDDARGCELTPAIVLSMAEIHLNRPPAVCKDGACCGSCGKAFKSSPWSATKRRLPCFRERRHGCPQFSRTQSQDGCNCGF